MAKTRNQRRKSCILDWQDRELEKLFNAISEGSCAAVAIGLDMAAQETNWGLSLFTLDPSYTKAQLRLILPNKCPSDETAEAFLREPTCCFLQRIITALRSKTIATALAVDAPFGWPEWHGKFTKNWSATATNRTKLQLRVRKDFERRLIDHELAKKIRLSLPGKKIRFPLLAVGADKIASAAYEWARCRLELGDLIDACDVGFNVEGKPVVTLFETYPAGFVKLNYPMYFNYKSGPKTAKNPTTPEAKNIRVQLLDAIRESYDFSDAECKALVAQACAEPKSDAFDGFLAALTAWDYLRWRKYRSDSHTVTTPQTLLGRKPTAFEIKKIKREGWILIRDSDLNDV